MHPSRTWFVCGSCFERIKHRHYGSGNIFRLRAKWYGDTLVGDASKGASYEVCHREYTYYVAYGVLKLEARKLTGDRCESCGILVKDAIIRPHSDPNEDMTICEREYSDYLRNNTLQLERLKRTGYRDELYGVSAEDEKMRLHLDLNEDMTICQREVFYWLRRGILNPIKSKNRSKRKRGT